MRGVFKKLKFKLKFGSAEYNKWSSINVDLEEVTKVKLLIVENRLEVPEAVLYTLAKLGRPFLNIVENYKRVYLRQRLYTFEHLMNVDLAGIDVTHYVNPEVGEDVDFSKSLQFGPVIDPSKKYLQDKFRGDLYVQEDKIEYAISTYENSLAQCNDPVTRYFLGSAFMMADDFEYNENNYQKIKKLTGDNYLELLYQIYEFVFDFSESKNIHQPIDLTESEIRMFHAMRDDLKAIESYLDKYAVATAYRTLGNIEHLLGNYQEAIHHYMDKTIKLFDFDYYKISILYRLLGKEDASNEYLKKAKAESKDFEQLVENYK